VRLACAPSRLKFASRAGRKSAELFATRSIACMQLLHSHLVGKIFGLREAQPLIYAFDRI
jgi:hypothetical protein